MIETCITFLLHKDNDIMEANVSLGEMQQKIKRLEGLCQVSISITNRKIPVYMYMYSTITTVYVIYDVYKL